MQLLATIAGGVATYHYPDHLSTRVEADAAGNVTATRGHLPYGETWYETGTASKWKFTSYERDAESNLDYAIFRYDNSRLGRFMTPDLLAGDIGDPQSLNRYAYVGNDPINFVDPLGLDQCAWDDGTVDDRPEDGGATKAECLLQGGEWIGGTDTTVTVNGDGSVDCDGNCVDPLLGFWDEYSRLLASLGQQGGGDPANKRCSSALRTAGANSAVLTKANASWQILIAATNGRAGITPAFLAAIGIRESGFQNIAQRGGGLGRGIFQIDLGAHPRISESQAFNPTFSASFAANLLSTNRAILAAAHPNLNEAQLMQATAASYNFGPGNISGNPNTIDVGSTGNNYGSNVVAIATQCF